MDRAIAILLERARARGWLEPGSRLLVACSGGADSTFLLRALAAGAEKPGVDLACVHVHHGLRGAEADLDAAFVEALARELGIPFLLRRASVPEERARRGRGSVESVARELRYRAFVDAAASVRAPRVATAHTRDDLVETVLLGWLRGGGIRAAQGIPPERPISFEPPVRVVRPLLATPRSVVLETMASHAWGFRTDASNLDAGPLRNRVRARLVPVLRELGGERTDASIARIADDLRGVEDLLARASQEFRARHGGTTPGSLPLVPLRDLPRALRRRVIRDAIESAARAPASQRVIDRIEGLIDAPAGRTESGPGRSRARRSTEGVVFLPEGRSGEASAAAIPLPVPGEAVALGHRFRAWVETAPPSIASLGPLDQAFDAGACAPPLSIRARRPGDRFRPSGASSPQRLAGFLAGRRVPSDARDRVPLLVSGDRIAWVVGHRVADDVRVRDGAARALRIRVEPVATPPD